MKTVFFDVDTQIDFLFPAGALYVPGAERLLPALARLARFARERSIRVVSTMDAHAENDPEFRSWPSHCVAGALGQRKPEATLAGPGQILIAKQALDAFTSAELPAVIERLAADRYVVYGVVTEYCVRYAALGLLRTGRPVEVVTDAILGLKDEDAARALAEVAAAGGRLTTVDQILRQ